MHLFKIVTLPILVFLIVGCTTTQNAGDSPTSIPEPTLISSGYITIVDDIPREEVTDPETGEPVPLNILIRETLDDLGPFFDSRNRFVGRFTALDEEAEKAIITLYDDGWRDEFYAYVENENITFSPRVELRFVPRNDSLVEVRTVQTGDERMHLLTHYAGPFEANDIERQESYVEGTLIIIDGGCMGIMTDSDETFLLLWPEGFNIGLYDNDIVVINPYGEVGYTIGDDVSFRYLTPDGEPNYGPITPEDIESFHTRQELLPVDGCTNLPYLYVNSMRE